ncbi:MAG: tetratricopeptide repeat protein, partial [Nitrospirae bacterium]|nr:tetratricopeptide repeat protein [Nitrospirota bacterium]
GIKGGHSPFTVHRSLFTVHYLRITAFGIFWFFITLSVESSIIPTRDIIFEHRLYLPSIGLIIAFVSAIFHFISYFSSFNLQPSSFLSRHASRITVLMLATFVVVSPIATYQRNIIWQDDITLWSDVIRKSPLNARGYNNLGGAFAAKGLTDKAIENYQIAVRLKPDFGQAHYNLGVAFGIKGLTDLLIEHLQIALKLEPDYPLPEAYYNLGIAYESKSLLNLAAQHYRTALMFRPDFTEAHDNYGVVLFKQGSIDEAIKEFQIALKIKPDYARAIENLQNAYIYKESKDKNKF